MKSIHLSLRAKRSNPSEVLIFIFCILFSTAAYSFTADESLTNPQQESRAENLFAQIKCVVCEGESLSESNAGIAVDMRAIIRKKIGQGETDGEITHFLTRRYGPGILQNPPLQHSTYLLWFSPLVLILIGLFFISRFLKTNNG